MPSSVERQERGWPAHFTLADRCVFSRNTLLTASSGAVVVVSTVGLLKRIDKDGYSEVNPGNYYETAVFRAEACEYGFRANVSQQVTGLGSRCGLSDPEDLMGADAMHEAMVNEVTQKLELEVISPYVEVDDADDH